jgi:hypothetical protein
MAAHQAQPAPHVSDELTIAVLEELDPQKPGSGVVTTFGVSFIFLPGTRHSHSQAHRNTS